LLELVQDLPEFFLFFWGHIPHLIEQVLYNTFGAQKFNAVRFQRIGRIGNMTLYLLFIGGYLL
jgi:hypothetical protein